MKMNEFLNLFISHIVDLELGKITHSEFHKMLIISLEDCLNNREKIRYEHQIEDIKELLDNLAATNEKTLANLWDELIIQKYTE